MSGGGGEAPRRPHTFYLTDALWDELDRRHHAERARVGARATKNEFVERVLRLGLGALASEAVPAPVAAGAAVASAPAAAEPALPRPARRPARDPLEQLRRASAPGRPAPIASAADGGARDGASTR